MAEGLKPENRKDNGQARRMGEETGVLRSHPFRFCFNAPGTVCEPAGEDGSVA